ncbi:hypothetical protein QBC32DRAFT_271833 [Pseudoneurospora amorphoporcata]|uniref:Uncharacterized protein n=1 Tax=Pseudoneurospora amorphoporcata TaxID=241081 RepID=A0AAN6NJ59_9PEZI|nr:hypothetical protein QBC32DRAFT_271833 [Pseudoneurospora amorphoporcata]
MDVPFDVRLSRIQKKEKTYTRQTRSTHSTSYSSASRASSTSSSNTIQTPTSDSEPTEPSALPTFAASMPHPKMERLLESSVSGSAGDFYPDRDDNPTANSTYLVLHQPTNLALTLVGGKLTLHKVPAMFEKGHPLESKCNWYWQCVETDGWLGFRNAASGRFLGAPSDYHGVGSFDVANDAHDRLQRLICVRAGGGCDQGPEAPQQSGYVMNFQNSSRLVKAWMEPSWKERSEISMTWKDGQEGTVWRFVKFV